MVKREEYDEYLKNYGSNISLCFLGHNIDRNKISEICTNNNFNIDFYGKCTSFLICDSNTFLRGYDLILLDSPRVFEECEFNIMKKEAIEISNALNKRVTVAYHSYVRNPSTYGEYSRQILIYSIKDLEEEKEVISLSCEERTKFNARDLLVLALDKQSEYNNQKQFKK